MPTPPGLGEVILELKQLEAAWPGVIVEEKPAGVAIHFRQAPSAESICEETAARVAAGTGMALQPGKMVIELKQSSVDKGQAMKTFMGAPPFFGTRPIFIGDDLTDEHGFAAASEFGGSGILVGPQRSTHATYRLADVSAVRTWLTTASEQLP